MYHLSLFISMQDAINTAEPSSMQDATTCEPRMVLLSMSSRSSVDRAPTWCFGGHGFNSYQGFRFFSLSHSLMLNISSFTLLLLSETHNG